jgi:hypothetical protein
VCPKLSGSRLPAVCTTNITPKASPIFSYLNEQYLD